MEKRSCIDADRWSLLRDDVGSYGKRSGRSFEDVHLEPLRRGSHGERQNQGTLGRSADQSAAARREQVVGQENFDEVVWRRRLVVYDGFTDGSVGARVGLPGTKSTLRPCCRRVDVGE